MSWFRTRSGRLIHSVGGLAAVHAARGWEVVPDEDAEAEVASGVAQTRADVEAELAAGVDELVRRADEAKAQRKPAPPAPVGELLVSFGTPEPSAEDKARVEKILDEESPR